MEMDIYTTGFICTPHHSTLPQILLGKGFCRLSFVKKTLVQSCSTPRLVRSFSAVFFEGIAALPLTM